MYRCFYSLKKVPDFSLQKYSALAETGVSGVISQHAAFWRQLNQWGQLFKGWIHLVYAFSPEKKLGERLQIYLCLEAEMEEGIQCVKRMLTASVLSPYYRQLEEAEIDCVSEKYAYQVNLLKKERFIASTLEKEEIFYTVSEWEMNEEARLYSMVKMLPAMQKKCAYIVSLYPVDYGDVLKDRLAMPMKRLREMSSFRIKATAGSVSGDGKDDGAKEALKYYEDLLEQLLLSPHFLANIQVLCESESGARMILDAAACEAVKEGTYTLYGEPFQNTIESVFTDGFQCLSDEKAPDSLCMLPHLYLAEEVSALALLPVLYEGETIELPKETVPEKMEGMLLGVDQDKHEIFYPWSLLPKHAFLAGMPGSGKTNAMMYLVTSMHHAGIPVLVLEPAKKEYRVLSTLDGMEDTYLFSPSANSMFPIHINPFEFPKGMKLAEHINHLLDIFNGTFFLDPPMPMLLVEGIQNCYEEKGWLPGMINTGELPYPTMSMLYTNIKKLFDKYKYDSDVRDNLESVLQVRIGSLMQREMGDIFDVEYSTFLPEEWLEKSAVIELASLGSVPTNFMMLTLLTLIREVLGLKPYRPDPQDDNKPRHVVFLEEAHNLIANTSEQTAGVVDPKIAATAFIKDMLAEVRALGEGIVIADQLPTAMAPEVVKNTSLKIGLRLTSADERNLLGQSMSADAVQIEQMGVYVPGQCLVGYEKLQKPFEMRIPVFTAKEEVLNDRQLFYKLVQNDTYYHELERSFQIIKSKHSVQTRKLRERTLELEELITQKWSEKDAVVHKKIRKQFGETYNELVKETYESMLSFYIFENAFTACQQAGNNRLANAHYRLMSEYMLEVLKKRADLRNHLYQVAEGQAGIITEQQRELHDNLRARSTMIEKSMRIGNNKGEE